MGTCPCDGPPPAAPAGIDAADLRALADGAEDAMAAVRREMRTHEDGALGRDILSGALMDLRLAVVHLGNAAQNIDLYSKVEHDD